MDRRLIILKKENGPEALSAPALGLNTIIFKHVYWLQQMSGERLQDHWSSGLKLTECEMTRLGSYLHEHLTVFFCFRYLYLIS